MVAHSILAIVAVLAAVGLGATAATGVLTPQSGGVMNLGTLAPGQTGNATATVTVHVTNSTVYKIGLEKKDRIGSVFSKFAVTVSVNGQQYNVTGEHEDSHLKLNSGVYSISVNLSYEVRNMLHTANVTNVPFLFLHPSENENQSGEHEFENETGSNSTQDSSNNVSLFAMDNQSGSNNQSQDNNNQGTNATSNSIVLASLTFHVNGNAGNDNGNESSDSVRVIPVALKN